MRKLMVLALSGSLLSLPTVSIPQANAQSTFYPGSPGSPYTTGSLKRRKHATQPQTQSASKKLKVKKARKK